MFNAGIIIWIVIALALGSLAWNISALIYAKTSESVYTKLAQDHALIRWSFGLLEVLVLIKIILVVLLTAAQITRNYFLANIGPDVVPDWLFGIVILQNVLFYGTITLPGVFLFAYTWGLKTVDKAREDKLDAKAIEYLNLERSELKRLKAEGEKS